MTKETIKHRGVTVCVYQDGPGSPRRFKLKGRQYSFDGPEYRGFVQETVDNYLDTIYESTDRASADFGAKAKYTGPSHRRIAFMLDDSVLYTIPTPTTNLEIEGELVKFKSYVTLMKRGRNHGR